VTKAASTTNNSNTNTGTTYNNGAYNNGKGVLPNTGPGDVLALGGISTFAGTIGHFLYSKRRRA
jgi:uncharacterized surface anchored protein